jgi:DNA-binding NtrC family response regulator
MNSSKQTNRKILIVDDETEVLEFLKIYLESLDWQIFTAETIPQALTLLEEQEFFLIITDIAMPEMDGYEFVNMIRERDIPAQVALMTGFGYNPNHTLVKINRNARYPILFKPFNRAKLVRTIDEAWRRHQERPPGTDSAGTESAPDGCR